MSVCCTAGSATSHVCCCRDTPFKIITLVQQIPLGMKEMIALEKKAKAETPEKVETTDEAEQVETEQEEVETEDVEAAEKEMEIDDNAPEVEAEEAEAEEPQPVFRRHSPRSLRGERESPHSLGSQRIPEVAHQGLLKCIAG
jgi:hypothetical protein